MSVLMAIRGLRKRLGDRTLLDIGSMELRRGSSYLLMGDNGAGKTTLLRILAGFEKADAGMIEFDGQPYHSPAARARLAPRMIYVHQHSYLFNTSVESNIAYGLVQAGVSRHEKQRRVAEAMDWAGVAHLADVPPHRLSGGEKQRVALARALVLQPALLLLDEPTANLDDAARLQVAELIRQIRNDNNVVLIATHDHDLIRLDETVQWRLDGGRLLTL